MPTYKAPLRDIRFLMNELFDYSAHYATLQNGENADPDTIEMILEGAADYCENVLSPSIKAVTKKVAISKMVKSPHQKALKQPTTSLYKAAGKDFLIRKNSVVKAYRCH